MDKPLPDGVEIKENRYRFKITMTREDFQEVNAKSVKSIWRCKHKVVPVMYYTEFVKVKAELDKYGLTWDNIRNYVYTLGVFEPYDKERGWWMQEISTDVYYIIDIAAQKPEKNEHKSNS